MKRTLLASLITVSTAVAGLTAPAPAAAGDPECRYAMPPTTTPPPPPLPANRVVQIGPVDGVNEGITRTVGVQQPRWSVVGIRPLGTADYDLVVYDCPDGRVVGTSIMGAGLVDFVALDGNRPWPLPAAGEKQLYANIYRYGGSQHGTFNAEYSTGGTPLSPQTAQTLVLRGTPAVVRDVTVAAGTTAAIGLRVLSGNADLFLVESTAADTTTWGRARVQAIAWSVTPGTAEERIRISVPVGVPSKTFGIVIVNNADYGEYVLVRS